MVVENDMYSIRWDMLQSSLDKRNDVLLEEKKNIEKTKESLLILGRELKKAQLSLEREKFKVSASETTLKWRQSYTNGQFTDTCVALKNMRARRIHILERKVIAATIRKEIMERQHASASVNFARHFELHESSKVNFNRIFEKCKGSDENDDFILENNGLFEIPTLPTVTLIMTTGDFSSHSQVKIHCAEVHSWVSTLILGASVSNESDQMNSSFDALSRLEVVDALNAPLRVSELSLMSDVRNTENEYPQLFIDGIHVGGYDKVYDLNEDGKLKKFLNEPGAFRRETSN